MDSSRTNDAAAAAAVAPLPLLLGVCALDYGSNAKAVNRRHRGAMSSVCVGRAVRCARVAPEPTARRLLFDRSRLCSKTKQHTEHPRQQAVVVDKAHGGTIDVASAPCQPSTS